MKRYFFYSSTGSGQILLQSPPTADNFGTAQSNVIYQVKLTPGATATILEGQTTTEADLITAITTNFSGAKVVLETLNDKTVYLLN